MDEPQHVRLFPAAEASTRALEGWEPVENYQGACPPGSVPLRLPHSLWLRRQQELELRNSGGAPRYAGEGAFVKVGDVMRARAAKGGNDGQ